VGNPIKLIVGLGNPGPAYTHTRHNAGAWYLETLSNQYKQTLKLDNKLFCCITKIDFPASQASNPCLLIKPTSYMNLSGQAVQAVQKFYKILPEETLIAHDELDLAPGIARIKFDGGHGGHNGLKDIFNKTNSKQYYRLRIGIGHPGHRDDVADYVLTKPSVADKQFILQSIESAIYITETLIRGDIDKAMLELHTNKNK
jgi:PTH1 family peptidyl-tRNA hydrolase